MQLQLCGFAPLQGLELLLLQAVIYRWLCAFGERLAVALRLVSVGFRARVTQADGSGTTRISRP